MNFICDNISMNQNNGHLTFAGQDVTDLAQQYGTPLYLLDEDRIRYNCRRCREAFAKGFGDSYRMLYASKANSFKQIYRIVQEESMGVDVVSAGEIHTARQAGFPMQHAYFHSNNKTPAEIRFAMDCGVGYFVADNREEIDTIEEEAAARGITQKILIRVTPGIDPHTYEAVATGLVDSKFGFAIETGQAKEITAYTLQKKHIELVGFHCHVGSMVFEENVYERTTAVMLQYIADIKAGLGYEAKMFDLGGGFGVRYVDTDPYLDLETKIMEIAEVFHNTCEQLELTPPILVMEPGRGIVADAGMTVYTLGTVKKIPGYKNYLAIDGGMTDNPRFALYGSSYTCLPANRMNDACDMTCSLVGKCCESGDIIQENILMPSGMCRGDLIAVCTTGAYNYSMASNYNRIARPPIVMLKGGESYLAVRRETLDDLLTCDL